MITLSLDLVLNEKLDEYHSNKGNKEGSEMGVKYGKYNWGEHFQR